MDGIRVTREDYLRTAQICAFEIEQLLRQAGIFDRIKLLEETHRLMVARYNSMPVEANAEPTSQAAAEVQAAQGPQAPVALPRSSGRR